MFNIDSEYRLFEIDFSFWVVENVSRGLGKARGSLLAHGCLVSLFFFLSSRLASQAHLPLRATWSSRRWNFFSSAFSNLLVGIPLVGMCHRVVYMYACDVEKKPQKEKCAS